MYFTALCTNGGIDNRRVRRQVKGMSGYSKSVVRRETVVSTSEPILVVKRDIEGARGK